MKNHMHSAYLIKGLLSLAAFLVSINPSYMNGKLLDSTNTVIDQHTWTPDHYRKVTQAGFRGHKLFTSKVDSKKLDLARLNAAIFYITNEKRVEKNLSTLTFHPQLEQMATIHSNDMLKDKFFSHTNPKNKDRAKVKDRANEVTIPNPFVAENIFMLGGPQEGTYLNLADKIVQAWMDSPPHKANVLHESALQLGCGSSYTAGFWTKKGSKKRDQSVKGYWFLTQNFQFYQEIGN